MVSIVLAQVLIAGVSSTIDLFNYIYFLLILKDNGENLIVTLIFFDTFFKTVLRQPSLFQTLPML